MPSAPSSINNPPADSRPVRVLFQALERDRLAQSLILSGERTEEAEQCAQRLAETILAPADGGPSLPLHNHPDFLTLRPAGKMRQISADSMRGLVRLLNHSPKMGNRKIAVVYDADRMNAASANIFLKTLEEPSDGTTIVLLTARPHFLLPTIRSRCLHFRLGSGGEAQAPDPALDAWLEDYRAWLDGFVLAEGEKLPVAGQIMRLYGLVARFQPLVKQVTSDAWKREKESPARQGLSEEEEIAMEEGLRVGIRDWVFASIEKTTRNFARRRIAEGDSGWAAPLAASVGRLEEVNRLLRLNVREQLVLEGFLLASLRIWGRR